MPLVALICSLTTRISHATPMAKRKPTKKPGKAPGRTILRRVSRRLSSSERANSCYLASDFSSGGAGQRPEGEVRSRGDSYRVRLSLGLSANPY